MLFLLGALKEDTLLKLFEERHLRKLHNLVRYAKSQADLPKGYLFPNFYTFYEGLNLSPGVRFSYQYLDTVNLRLEIRESDLIPTYTRRYGLGVMWPLFDPQILSVNMASRYRFLHVVKNAEIEKHNAKTNLRILLRIYLALRALYLSLDSLLSDAHTLAEYTDTLFEAGRISRGEIVSLKMRLLRVEGLKERVEGELRRIRDTLVELTGVEVDDVELSGEDIYCLTYDSTLLYHSKVWEMRAEALWWMPKVLLFGEVWDGYSTPSLLSLNSGAVYGLRVVMRFDETGRLRFLAKKRELEMLSPGGSRRERVETHPKSDLLERADSLYEEAKRLYEAGRLDFPTLFAIRYERFSLQAEHVRQNVEHLRRSLCSTQFGPLAR